MSGWASASMLFRISHARSSHPPVTPIGDIWASK
jgi:hypothetical protein